MPEDSHGQENNSRNPATQSYRFFAEWRPYLAQRTPEPEFNIRRLSHETPNNRNEEAKNDDVDNSLVQQILQQNAADHCGQIEGFDTLNERVDVPCGAEMP